MLTLKTKIRQKFGRKTQKLRDKGIIPAILYGPKIENIPLEVSLKEFESVYKESGESSLISIEVSSNTSSSDKSEAAKKFLVLIHKVERNSLTGDPIHIDFYQPVLTEEVEATVPLVFEGEALAVKELGGTLIKEIQELTVRALPQNLPHEIKVNIEKLKTFDDEILIKDLQLPENIKIQRDLEEIVAKVAPPEKVEEELEQPIEEEKEEKEKEEEERSEEAEKEK